MPGRGRVVHAEPQDRGEEGPAAGLEEAFRRRPGYQQQEALAEGQD